MIRSISFENFRGFQKLEISEIEQITLISGKNNSGKSSVLEGLFLLLDHLAPDSFVKLNHFRGLSVNLDAGTLWEPLFYNLDTEKTIKIGAVSDEINNVVTYSKDSNYIPTDGGGAPQDIWNQFVTTAKNSYSLKFSFSADDYCEDGHFMVNSSGMLRNVNTNQNNGLLRSMTHAQYINSNIVSSDSTITEWFGRLELQGKKEQIVKTLQLLEPSISDVSTIAMRGQTQLYARIEGKLLPLKLAGDGLNKLLFILLAIIANPNSIILIDEIEGGFHYSMYPMVWKVISVAAQENDCQILATTHSYECIEGAIKGIEATCMQEKFCYYRLERTKKGEKVFRYSGDLLGVAVDSNMEVR